MAPKQRPGQSKQDYRTPPEFLEAVKQLLRIEEFDIDLAASPENAVCPRFYTEQDNSLEQPWKVGEGWNWCNPPFAKLEPWVMKAFNEMAGYGAKTAMLVPAAVGANWWRDWVDDMARVYFLNGRLAFIPDRPKWLYPKDCALLLYAPFVDGYRVWDWRP